MSRRPIAGEASPSPDSDEVVVAIRLPRSALVTVAPPPALLSQLNCAHVGLDRRGYLEAVRDGERAGAFVAIRRGKLRLVALEAFIAFLRATSTRPITRTPPAAAAAPPESGPRARDAEDPGGNFARWGVAPPRPGAR